MILGIIGILVGLGFLRFVIHILIDFIKVMIYALFHGFKNYESPRDKTNRLLTQINNKLR